MASLICTIIIQHNLHHLTKSKTTTKTNLHLLFHLYWSAQSPSHTTSPPFSTSPLDSAPSNQAASRIPTRSDPSNRRLFARKSDPRLSQHGQVQFFFLTQHRPSSCLGPATSIFWQLDQFQKMRILDLLLLQACEQQEIFPSKVRQLPA